MDPEFNPVDTLPINLGNVSVTLTVSSPVAEKH